MRAVCRACQPSGRSSAKRCGSEGHDERSISSPRLMQPGLAAKREGGSDLLGEFGRGRRLAASRMRRGGADATAADLRPTRRLNGAQHSPERTVVGPTQMPGAPQHARARLTAVRHVFGGFPQRSVAGKRPAGGSSCPCKWARAPDAAGALRPRCRHLGDIGLSSRTGG